VIQKISSWLVWSRRLVQVLERNNAPLRYCTDTRMEVRCFFGWVERLEELTLKEEAVLENLLDKLSPFMKKFKWAGWVPAFVSGELSTFAFEFHTNLVADMKKFYQRTRLGVRWINIKFGHVVD
jgi:hypothetical protein